MDPSKKKTVKRKSGAQREKEKKKRAIEEESSKYHKLTDLFRASTTVSDADEAGPSKLFINAATAHCSSVLSLCLSIPK